MRLKPLNKKRATGPSDVQSRASRSKSHIESENKMSNKNTTEGASRVTRALQMKAHPEWCMRHDCHHPDGTGANHRDQHRRGLVHRYGDCNTGTYDDDGQDFTVRVSWELIDSRTFFSESEEWSLGADLIVLDGDTGKFVRVHVSSTDLRLIADHLTSEADHLDEWRRGEIARRVEGGKDR